MTRRQGKKLSITQADVENFRTRCINARALFVHHEYLFNSNPDQSHKLKQTSRLFFGDVCSCFRDQLIIHVCALAERRGKILSVNFFFDNADWAEFDISPIRERVECFYKTMKPARDNLLAHSNRDTLLRQERLGAADSNLWNQFWLDMQQVVHLLSKKYLKQDGCYINAIVQTDLPALVARVRQDTGSS